MTAPLPEASDPLFLTLFQNAPDGILVVDEGGTILLANAQAEAMFGGPDVRLAGRPLESLLPERFRAGHGKHRSDFLSRASVRPMRGHPVLLGLRLDGTEFPVEIGLSAIASVGRTLAIAMVRDVTERTRIEEAARRAQRLETLGRLARGVAHDFNNLLTVIQTCTDLLMQSLPGADPRRKLAADAHDAGQRAGELARRLLAFGRERPCAPRPLDLNAQIEAMLGLLQRLVGAAVSLSFDPDPELAHVLMDPSHLEQVLVNLAVNARDAMPDGGKLGIGTARAAGPDGAGICAGAFEVLTVTDSGVGMDEATLGRIFEPFFTTKAEGKGTGLGLTLVHGLVQQTGGRVAVDSRPGAGTTFRIYLPRAEAPGA